MCILKKKIQMTLISIPTSTPCCILLMGCAEIIGSIFCFMNLFTVSEYICECKAVGHFRKCCKFQDSKPVSGIDCLDYCTPLLSSCIWECLLASFPCVTSKCLPVKKSGPNGHCNCPGPRDSEEQLFLNLSWLPSLPFISLPMHLGALTLPQPRLTILDIFSIAQKHINMRETFL